MKCFRLIGLAFCVTLCSFMCGCKVGYDSLLFATKTNVGLDVDMKPPTLELSISRVEGVFAPTYEGGQTPPVAASFRYRQSGPFTTALASTFLAGDAAMVFSGLYDGDDVMPTGNDLSLESGTYQHLDAAIKLDTLPEFQEISEKDAKAAQNSTVTEKPASTAPVEKGRVRPVFFGTSTSLGIRATWTGATAAYPDSLHVGYKRKELAWAPVMTRKVDQKWHVETPSLLATIDAHASTGIPDDTKGDYLQYFATGKAATAMAFRQPVRETFIRRLDPDQAENVEIKLQDRINAWLRDGQESPQDARVTQLKAWLTQNVPAQNPDQWPNWIVTAPLSQLRQAVKDLGIR